MFFNSIKKPPYPPGGGKGGFIFIITIY